MEDRLKTSIIFTKKRPKNISSQFSFWKKTLGLADESKELFFLKILFFDLKTMILHAQKHHLTPLGTCLCTSKACILAH